MECCPRVNSHSLALLQIITCVQFVHPDVNFYILFYIYFLNLNYTQYHKSLLFCNTRTSYLR